MRVTLFRNGDATTQGGHVISVPETYEELLELTSNLFNFLVTTVYTRNGGKISKIKLIKDDEVLYVSDGQPFVDPGFKGESHSPLPVDPQPLRGQWVTLNVGGQHFTTTRSTLIGREPGSMLARMFWQGEGSGPCWENAIDATGAYLVDRSPRYFEPILNYLRHGQLILDPGINPEGVLEEAKFFGMTSLMERLEEVVRRSLPVEDHTPITRKEFIRMLMSRPTNCELRCQGMNFEGADLSKLDLRFSNFKLASLKGANLRGANLSNCSLERANLSSANLDGANLQGVKMVLANLEGSSLKGCNFEDPAGSKANMEGVNMKGVDLESSQMSGVNLRVATLKNSNLQNCNLHCAILAGTDLENCNLSGCDLRDANLRGANVIGAKFEGLVTPIHMSQSVR